LAKVQEPVNEGIFKAQVQSKLLWLKMQGKEEEYRKYEKAAAEVTRARKLAGCKIRSLKDVQDKKAVYVKRKVDRKAKRAAKQEARAAKKYAKGMR
jgi:hypothetical protein